MSCGKEGRLRWKLVRARRGMPFSKARAHLCEIDGKTQNVVGNSRFPGLPPFPAPKSCTFLSAARKMGMQRAQHPGGRPDWGGGGERASKPKFLPVVWFVFFLLKLVNRVCQSLVYVVNIQVWILVILKHICACCTAEKQFRDPKISVPTNLTI